MTLEYPRDMLERLFARGELNVEPGQFEQLLLLVDTVFFASQTIEEAEHVRVAIVHDRDGSDGLAKVVDGSPGEYEDPDLAWEVTEIPRRPFNTATLAKLARGIAYGTQLIVVGGTGSELWIDGVARIRRRTDGGSALRIAAPRPGVVVFEQHATQIFRYESGQQVTPPIDVIGQSIPVRQAIGAITGTRRDAETEAAFIDGHAFYSHWEMALRRLIRKMRSTEAGAVLALLPHAPSETTLEAVRYGRVDPLLVSKRIETEWQLRLDSLSKRIANAGDHDLARDKVREQAFAENAAAVAGEDLDDALDDVAQLSAIDGAVLAGPRLAIYGAGYLIPLEQLPPGTLRKALDANANTSEDYVARHGARHQAGFSFAYQNPGGLAFIVSEDGPVTCAHRISENDPHVYAWSVEVLET